MLHTHPEYEMLYFHHGKCNYLIGEKIYSLRPGDLIIMHGMTLHSAKMLDGEKFVRTVIHFEPAFVHQMMERLMIKDPLEPFRALRNYTLHLSGADRLEFETELARLEKLRADSCPLNRQRFQLAFLELLLFTQKLCNQPLHHVSGQSEKERNAQNIIHFLEKHFMKDLTLDALSESMHMSKFYLSKIFKEATGMTIFDYLYQRRINQAKVLLHIDPGLSVTEAGYRVGFKHLAHFSRMFKSKVGLSPEQYKKTLSPEYFHNHSQIRK